MNTTVAENKVDVHYSQSALQSIKEKLIATDIINQLDIADGLKELLISLCGSCSINMPILRVIHV
jgi:hypothetical protein